MSQALSFAPKLGGQRLQVKILEPAKGGGVSVRRGAVVEVTSRRLVIAWAGWPALSATEQAERDKQTVERREYQAKYEREFVADPSRMMPDAYDRMYARTVRSIEDLHDWPIPSPHFLWRADRRALVDAALPVLKGLPVDLVRDLLAAASLDTETSPPSDRAEGTVGAVLEPMVELLSDTMNWSRHGSLANRVPDDVWATSSQFVDACVAAVDGQGGHVQLPASPQFEDSTFPGPGWLRVSYGRTSGRRIHAPDCHVLKSQQSHPVDAPTWPAWRLNLPGSDPCGNCGGPTPAATPALLGFLTAAVVWQHRSGKAVEQWQLRSCLTMLADAARSRAIEVEPDRDWVNHVVTALLSDRPGDSWDAYKAMSPFSHEYEQLNDTQQMDALRLTCSRLILLDKALPASRRPNDHLQPVEDIAGDSRMRRETVRSWYSARRSACIEALPDFDLLLFTLPDAVKW
ncbi:hypothetical protein [Dactylosporangium sp. NPDC050588]|uniref:hypothetical protein n=1 Tax=Dactylosporangium sp. NPDC050588 TaxID=3157211 RepID=UPI0033CAC185